MSVPDRQHDARLAPARPGLGPRRRSSLALAIAFLLGSAMVYLVAVRTAVGQRAEDALLGGFAEDAWIHGFHDRVGLPPLRREGIALALGIVAILLLGAIRRRWTDLVIAMMSLAGTFGGIEVLERVLTRPDLAVPEFGNTGNTYPSGHAAVPVALVLAAWLVAPSGARPWLAVLGGAWAAAVAGGVQALLWHRPSDVIGAAMLASAAVLLVCGLVGHQSAPSGQPPSILMLVVAVPVALVCGGRQGTWTASLVFGAAAWLVVMVIWLTMCALGGAFAKVKGR